MTPLEDALRALYDREINVSVASFWDAGYRVRIGDDWNGFKVEREFGRDEVGDIGDWLLAEAARLYPEAFRGPGS